jgi:hypothetical protein
MAETEAQREARAAYYALNQALTSAGLPFHFASFTPVYTGTTAHPTFTVSMTVRQAEMLAETLTPGGESEEEVSEEEVLRLMTDAALTARNEGQIDQAQTRGDITEILRKRFAAEIVAVLRK